MPERIMLDGVSVDAITEPEVVAAVRGALDRGEGGRIVTPNVDILRRARLDAEVRGYLEDATLVVADGTPLVWASRLAGTPLPERVTGSDLIWSLSAGLGEDGRSVYLLGGEPEDPGWVDGAGRAAGHLAAACPGLRIAGWRSPEYGFEDDPYLVASVCRDVVEAKPDLVYVGVGFPKQEWLVSLLRTELPFTWFLGCGAAINFVAGDRERAPEWMQKSGLEWAHRLGNEPRRLARRYLRHDAPYALRLLASNAVRR
ncbi:WecB/TagA/CpsF family glycosyltransferase [Phytohabitans suffuscus]|uniref:Acetyl-mannosamine transferase n=1 Tax=Phytohabitans suffuscus TaxID=624315 RepID=A0A6F8YLG5_9ACTN|nr:WecB/TagA/CpsF family glycosyltransferase [Phytohabitans suffuscus]BCB86896.1 acetyl-mannosamine transferase [Phytohabitans suffuscus]